MAKILLVEDDNNLREIYEARLMAEGYDIVSARDGEEALTVAMKERPDLVISDVMMPKISGFDMLDILRTTEETKNVKIIMMTALSQAEDKERAEKLGADRYLVKSQVTLEDVAKVAKEVLEGTAKPVPSVEASTSPTQTTTAPSAVPPVATTPPTQAATPTATSAAAPTTQVTTPSTTPLSTQIEEEEKAIAQQLEGMMGTTTSSAAATSDPAASTSTPADSPALQAVATAQAAPAENQTTQTPAPTPTPPPVSPEPTAPASPQQNATTPPQAEEPAPETNPEIKSSKKVIEPINDLSQDMKPKLDELLEKEKAKEVAETGIVGPTPLTQPPVENDTTAQETPIAAPTPDTKIDPNTIAL